MYKIIIILLSYTLFIISCDSGDHIRIYRLPKQEQPLDNAIKDKNEFVLKWETPEMWTEVQGHSMRLASFSVPTTKGKGDLSITTFSGISGGVEANVNRWLGQIELEPLSLIEIQKLSLTSRGTLGDYQYFKLINEDQKENAILASIFQLKDRTIFVKLSINGDGISEIESEFRSFCESIYIPE